jgi:uncharacterized membrane protein
LQYINICFFTFLFLIQLSYIYCWLSSFENLLLFGCVRIIMEMLINYVFLSVLSYFGTTLKIQSVELTNGDLRVIGVGHNNK